MAVTLEIRVRNLIPEFPADTPVLLRVLQTAGTVTTGSFQSVPDGLHHLLILIEPNSHSFISFLFFQHLIGKVRNKLPVTFGIHQKADSVIRPGEGKPAHQFWVRPLDFRTHIAGNKSIRFPVN